MKEISTLDELFEIQDEKYNRACRLDLMFLRVGYRIIDGFVLLVGAECKQDLELFYLSKENYDKWTDGSKDYLKHYYGIE